jgi:hypothetical protein
MAGPIARAILGCSPAEIGELSAAGAIGDTLPEGVMGLAWF